MYGKHQQCLKRSNNSKELSVFGLLQQSLVLPVSSFASLRSCLHGNQRGLVITTMRLPSFLCHKTSKDAALPFFRRADLVLAKRPLHLLFRLPGVLFFRFLNIGSFSILLFLPHMIPSHWSLLMILSSSTPGILYILLLFLFCPQKVSIWDEKVMYMFTFFSCSPSSIRMSVSWQHVCLILHFTSSAWHIVGSP